MRNVPTPVGLLATASMALKPTPLAVGSTNQGSSQPSTSSVAAPMLKIQKVLAPAPRRVGDAACGRAPLLRPGPSLGTDGHVHAEETDGPEGEDDHQDGEDERVAPLATGKLAAENVDDADDEAADAGADDV